MMAKFDKYSKWLAAWIPFALSHCFVPTSCTKDETIEDPNSQESVMLFGVENIAQTKVSYDDQPNGGLSAKFDAGDNIGVYAFYNNFYYYYNDYGTFAESVIFANQGMTLNDDLDATYSPLRTWTFSTLYGTAPHTLDVMSYYPLVEGYNPGCINMYSDSTGAATFEYYYYSYVETNGVKVYTLNSDKDFMTAQTRYSGYSDSSTFRTAMLALEKIPLSFTRRLASMNFQVTKPDDYTTDIVVTGLTVYFKAPTKFTETVGANPSRSWGWEEEYEDTIFEASTTCKEILEETSWDDTPEEGATNEVDNLLEDEELLFFPPGTEIQKIVFTLTDGGEATTYTWHAHVAEIVANTHYTLNLELDPARAN